MVISITRKHIRKGTRGNCKRCPLVLALQDSLTRLNKYETPHVFVDKNWIRISRAQEIAFVVLEMNPDTAKRVLSFDKTGQMEPFELDLTELKIVSGDLKSWSTHWS